MVAAAPGGTEVSPPVNQCWEGGAELAEGVELGAKFKAVGRRQQDVARAISEKKKKKKRKGMAWGLKRIMF